MRPSSRACISANVTPRPANGVVVHTASPTEIRPGSDEVSEHIGHLCPQRFDDLTAERVCAWWNCADDDGSHADSN